MANPNQHPALRDAAQRVLSLARGTITDAELAAVAGHHKDRKAFVRSNHGHKSHAHAKHVLAAATDLGEQLAADRGGDTSAVQFARSEVVRVRG